MEQVANIGTTAFGGYAIFAFGLGLIVIGAAVAIGWIASRAVESVARQPEIKSDILTLVILSSAFIEGIAFFAAIICLIIVFTK